jgi:hypothetical protein
MRSPRLPIEFTMGVDIAALSFVVSFTGVRVWVRFGLG